MHEYIVLKCTISKKSSDGGPASCCPRDKNWSNHWTQHVAKTNCINLMELGTREILHQNGSNNLGKKLRNPWERNPIPLHKTWKMESFNKMVRWKGSFAHHVKLELRNSSRNQDLSQNSGKDQFQTWGGVLGVLLKKNQIIDNTPKGSQIIHLKKLGVYYLIYIVSG